MPSPIFAHRYMRKPSPQMWCGFMAVVCAIFITDAIAVESPLTLQHAQLLALERSRQLPAKDYAVQASRDMAVAAAQLPDPTLKAGIDNLPTNGADRLSLS